jgi:SSS family solute:Na+ symporter
LTDKVAANKNGGDGFLHTWQGTGVGAVTNPLGSSWIGIIFGLGFLLSFGYWTTNFAEVQRAMSARNMSAARRTPLIGAFPKLFIPALTIIPGLIALVLFPKLGADSGQYTYTNAIPLLINKYLPNGVLGIAVTGLLAAFMAGMAANVSSFNTVVTYDIWQTYIKKDRDDAYYLRAGRVFTVVGILIGIGTAFIAAGYSNIMNYVQVLFSFFNVPLFVTFIIGIFWKRMTAWAGFSALLGGTLGALTTYLLYKADVVSFRTDLEETFWGSGVAFLVASVLAVGVSMFTQPKPEDELQGLVRGIGATDLNAGELVGDSTWYRNPLLLGGIALGLSVALYIPFW